MEIRDLRGGQPASSRSSKREEGLCSSRSFKVMGFVVSLASLVCYTTDHVVKSNCSSGSRSKTKPPAHIVSVGLSVCRCHRRVMRLRRANRGPGGVSGRESAGHFQNVICMCHAQQEGPFRQGVRGTVPAAAGRIDSCCSNHLVGMNWVQLRPGRGDPLSPDPPARL